MERSEDTQDRTRDRGDGDPAVSAVAELEEELTVAAAAPGPRRLVRLEELLLARAALSRRD